MNCIDRHSKSMDCSTGSQKCRDEGVPTADISDFPRSTEVNAVLKKQFILVTFKGTVLLA